MRRVGHLFDAVCSFDNLLHAFRAARRGCGWSPEVERFFVRLEPELLRLRRELLDDRYRPGVYRYFAISDPKPRTIAVASFRDRVVHHAVVAVLGPIYERRFIADSYATRRGKGTHRAVRRAQTFLRRWPWYLKMDVEGYFDSVDHEVLLSLLRRQLKDARLLGLLERLVRNSREPGRGLPIGNLTSQFLANVYLDPFDHEVKARWGVQGYLRYMDDFVLFGADRQTLSAQREAVAAYLAERLRLRLKERACWLNRSSHGLTFLGRRVFAHHIRTCPANRRRTLRRVGDAMGLWNEGVIDDIALAQRLASLYGYLDYFRRPSAAV